MPIEPALIHAVVHVKGAGAESAFIRSLAQGVVIGHQACVCHEPFEEGLRVAGITPDFVFRSNDNAAVQAMVRAGVGTAVMPLLAIDPGDPRVRVQRLDPPLPERSILVAVPRDRVEKPAEQFVRRALALGATLTGSRAEAWGRPRARNRR